MSCLINSLPDGTPGRDPISPLYMFIPQRILTKPMTFQWCQTLLRDSVILRILLIADFFRQEKRLSDLGWLSQEFCRKDRYAACLLRPVVLLISRQQSRKDPVRSRSKTIVSGWSAAKLSVEAHSTLVRLEHLRIPSNVKRYSVGRIRV